MKTRRLELRERGICVDCQWRAVKPGRNRQGKAHTCCETCLAARRDRWHNGAVPPLFRAIRKAEEMRE